MISQFRYTSAILDKIPSVTTAFSVKISRIQIECTEYNVIIITVGRTMQFTELFVSDILTPAVITLLAVAGIAVFVHVRPFAVLRTAAATKRRGDVGGSSLSAMLTALAGTLGVGNISGVALAIACGGCGAVFWMWVSALLAMAVKYAEILLASHYRIIKKDGSHGGAPIYIKRAFKGGTGKALSLLFTVLCMVASLTVGSSVQSGAAAEIAQYAFGVHPALCGVVMAICVTICISGGSKRIGKVTDVLVPLMSGAYIILSLWVIIKETHRLPSIFSMIIRSAMNTRSAAGGAVGFGIAAMRYGVSRGLISNEAGCGTAPFAHARAEREPAEQGIFGIAEVCIDTVIMCTLTAITVIAAYGGNVPKNTAGMVIVCEAYGKYIGAAAPGLLCVAVILFAFGSIICWYYYGIECLLLSGAKRTAKHCFAAAFIICISFGAVVNGRIVWLCADLCFDMLLALNTITVLKELGTVKKVTDTYLYRFKKQSVRSSTARSLLSQGKARAMPHSETEAP